MNKRNRHKREIYFFKGVLLSGNADSQKCITFYAGEKDI